MKWLKSKLNVDIYWLAGGGAVLIIALIVAKITRFASGVTNEEYWKGFSIEAAGKLYDVVLIILLFGGYEFWRQRKEKISELKRRINDFKKINNEYGSALIGASLRELRRYEITAIDFKGITLSDFKFSDGHDIASIRGSVFSDGFYVKNASRNHTELTSVDFSDVDCSDVTFGMGNLSFGVYKNCRFWNAQLFNSSFRGVRLEWDESTVIADINGWQEIVDETTEGEPIYCQIYKPAFDGADLSQAIFDDAKISFADFRGTQNILSASFKNVRGIETCFFDNGVFEALRESGRIN